MTTKGLGLVILLLTFLPSAATANTLNIAISAEGYELYKDHPTFAAISKAFSEANVGLEWAVVPSSVTPAVAANQGDYDGSIGYLPLGLKGFDNLVQVPVMILRQSMFPVVLAGKQCPQSRKQLAGMKIIGVDGMAVFDAAEARLQTSIPRVPSFRQAISALETDDYNVTISFDYTLPQIEAASGTDLDLCDQTRVKAFQFYIYLNKQHAGMVDVLKPPLAQHIPSPT